MVWRKNGCRLTMRGDVVVFYAPYLGRDGLESSIKGLLGFTGIMDIVPNFHDRKSLDLKTPEKGLVDGATSGYDRELRLVLRVLKRYVVARREFPSPERLWRWVNEAHKHDGRLTMRRKEYIMYLFRVGDGKLWIRVADGKRGFKLVPMR